MDLFNREQQIYDNARNHLSSVKAGAEYDINELKTITKAYGRLLKDNRRLMKAADNMAGDLHGKALDLFDKDLAKSRFLARMSHEIRTPISAVLGISEIQLQDPSLSQDKEEAFAKIFSSAHTLLGIVNDILDLSKIEAGKMSVINEEYDVAGLITDVINLNMVYLTEKNLEFRVVVDEQLPARLLGDEIRIKQILNNLLSNSFKYTTGGFVEFSIKPATKPATQCVEEETIFIEITIKDTGHGMTEEQLEALHSEYNRFHEKEQPSVVGTGLGMPITFSLVALMDATLDIASEVGKGTTWVLRIPQDQVNAETVGAKTAKDLANFKVGVKAKVEKFERTPMPYGKVLVVDDVDTNLYVARGLLALYKLQIDTATGGREALEKVDSGNVYDIIFLDHMMPDLDGVETMKLLRERGYNHPIIALTANALTGQADEYLQSGFDGVVSKPIQTLYLNEILDKYVRDKRGESSGEVLVDESKARLLERLDEELGELVEPVEPEIDDYLLSPEIQAQIRADFAVSQSNAVNEIVRFVSEGNLKSAHHVIHTLRGHAGLMNERNLVIIAEKIENALKAEELPDGELVEALEREVSRILKAI